MGVTISRGLAAAARVGGKPQDDEQADAALQKRLHGLRSRHSSSQRLPRGSGLTAAACQEALAAQPGQSTTNSTILADWFWRETTAGRVLFAVQEVSKQSAIPGLQAVAAGLLISRARSAESPFAKA
jgi:hypothetical protein